MERWHLGTGRPAKAVSLASGRAQQDYNNTPPPYAVFRQLLGDHDRKVDLKRFLSK